MTQDPRSGSPQHDPGAAGGTAAPAPHSPLESVLLHLGPGVVNAAAYLALVPVARVWGLPSAAALGASAVAVTGPLLLVILILVSRRRRREPTIALRRVPPVGVTLGWATVMMLAAAAAFGLARPVTAWLEQSLFGAWPEQWKPQLGTTDGYSASALVWTAVLLLLGSALVAAPVEEAYFRGFLLPRMPVRLGRAAPLVHTALFAVYHVSTPWLVPSRILAVLPLTYIALRTRSILPGLLAHVVLNLIDVVVIVAFVLRGLH